MAEQDVLYKLNEMHTDIRLILSDLTTTQSDVAEHELILRGQSKMNGLVGDVRNIKTSQSTVQKIWILLTSGLATIIAWLEMDK